MKYRIYIDEVGNHDLSNTDNPNHRFLSLTGVILELDYVEKILHPQMESLKKDFFGHHPDEPIIFHRKELVNAKYPFHALKAPEIRENFDRKLAILLQGWNYFVITVCIDKKNHLETYSSWRYDPYHYCLEILLERYIFFLESMKVRGDVMTESRGGKEDKLLKDTFTKLYNEGNDYVASERFSKSLTSRQLKVKSKSNNVSGLQLADLIAHPSRNEILMENGLRKKELPIFGKKVSEILKDKYYKRGDKILGKKLL